MYLKFRYMHIFQLVGRIGETMFTFGRKWNCFHKIAQYYANAGNLTCSTFDQLFSCFAIFNPFSEAIPCQVNNSTNWPPSILFKFYVPIHIRERNNCAIFQKHRSSIYWVTPLPKIYIITRESGLTTTSCQAFINNSSNNWTRNLIDTFLERSHQTLFIRTMIS